MHHLPLLGAVAALCVASAHGQAPFYDHFGESSQTQLGYWIAPLGDIDNDGSADYISGAPFDGARRYARLFSGRHGTTIRDTVQPTSVLFYAHRVCGGGDVNADGVPDYGVATWFLGGQVWIHSGKDGSIIHTKNGSPSDTLGYDIRIISDIDGDKFDDFMAGSNFGGVNNTGYASIWSGKTGQVIRTHDGPVGFGSYGRVISSGGDMDGDGTDDYAVSAPGLSHAGRVDVFSGKTGKLIRSVQGGTSGHWFGISVDLTGDLDRDGFADLVVGALSGGPNNAGYVNIYAGKDGSLIRTLDGVANLDQFGFAAAWAGDVNGDGFVDLLVGAPEADVNGSASGSATLYNGLWLRFGTGPQQLGIWHGKQGGDNFGKAVAGIGDATGDGVDDFAIGAIGDDQNASNSGLARIYSGADVSLSAASHLYSTAAAPQLSMKLDAGVSHAGGLYVVLGSAAGTSPGLPFGPITVPLNFDTYFNVLLASPGSLIVGSVGLLDASGQATASFFLPSNVGSNFVGLQLDHAFVAFDAQLTGPQFVSNPYPLTLQN